MNIIHILEESVCVVLVHVDSVFVFILSIIND